MRTEGMSGLSLRAIGDPRPPMETAAREPENHPPDRRRAPELHESGAAVPPAGPRRLVRGPYRAHRAALRPEHVGRLPPLPAPARARPLPGETQRVPRQANRSG